MNKKLVLLSIVFSLFCFVSTNLFAEMTQEQKATMEAMQKYATPGKAHKALNFMEGSWKYKLKWRMAAQAPAEESMGTSENAWVLGKRFIHQKVKGKMANGQEFQGMGYFGYDNMKKHYNTIWMDDMGTGMMTGKANYNKWKKTFKEKGTFSCPMTGEKDRSFTGIIKVKNKNRYSYVMMMKDPQTGKEFKALEINYERVKSNKVTKR